MTSTFKLGREHVCGHRLDNAVSVPRPVAPAIRLRLVKTFFKTVARATPFEVRALLTNNSREFTDPLFGKRAKALPRSA